MIHRWLARRPRFHLHFTPTSASWINLVERWFASLTEKQIRRGSPRKPPDTEECYATDSGWMVRDMKPRLSAGTWSKARY